MTDMTHVLPPTQLLIDGNWRTASSGKTIAVTDPATENIVAEVESGTAADAALAVDAAERAFLAWSHKPPRERAEILRRAYQLMIDQLDRIATLIVLESGKAYAEAQGEVKYAAEFLRWNSEEAVRAEGSLGHAPAGGSRLMVLRQPIGVCLFVTPWNFPAAMATRKIGPALAAGCTVVLKPATETPLTALLLGQLFLDAGVPPGVVNIVPSPASSGAVASMLRDPRVRKLSFTGSTEVGRTLLAQASENIVKCSMELGGNAPFIVLADADLDVAVNAAMVAKLRNGGESCTAANRFLVDESVADAFAEKFAQAMKSVRVGPGMDRANQLGPLINEKTRSKVQEIVADALDQGARLLTGGHRLPGKGFFHEPTVLAHVPRSARALRQEIFGPVAPITTFSGIDDAVALANDTEFGLVSFVCSRDLSRALSIAERLECGMVGINRGVVSDPAAPFGGWKQSGVGREGGHEGLLDYLEMKYVALSW